MKRLCITFLLLLLVAAACKKVSGPADGNSIQPNNNRDSLISVTTQINGKIWHTDSASAMFITSSANDSGAIGISITAYKNPNTDSNSSIVFYITLFTGPGTYNIDPPYNTATYYKGTVRNFASSGQVVVTSDTAYSLIGTFNFTTGADTVANGVFNVAMP